MKRRIFIAVLLAITAAGAVYMSRSRPDTDLKGLAASCNRADAGGTAQCREQLIRRIGSVYGADRSLALLYYIYVSDPQSAASCHAIAHTIGQTAYLRFRSTGEVPLSDKTSFCAFGFFHGFMETLLSAGGSIRQAQQFCDTLDARMGNSVPATKLACYHGVGHGVTDIHNTRAAGQEQKLVSEAAGRCREFARTTEELKLCATGIFDSLSIAYYTGENGFIMRKTDPLWICREQDEPLAEACFLDLMPAVLWMGNQDLGQALPIVLSSAPDGYTAVSVAALAEASVRYTIHSKSDTVYLETCRSLNPRNAEACIRGLSAGFMQFGEPGQEADDALRFCRNPLLSETERDICMKSVITGAKSRYPSERVALLCHDIEEPYQTYCR